MERFGEKLRVLRKQGGLTMRQLASLLEVNSHSHIAGLEAGYHNPSVELVLKIARHFDVTTDQLLKDELELDETDENDQE